MTAVPIVTETSTMAQAVWTPRPTGFPTHFDICVATKDGKLPGGLEHLPWPNTVMTSTAPGWANAANQLLDDSTHDVLFCDDDIMLTPLSLANLAQYYEHADVFGFTLIQATAEGNHPISHGHFLGPNGNLYPLPTEETHFPWYLAHVTASCMYVKRRVVEAGIRFPVWPGVHSEDVAFTYDCWLHGFKVAYLPGPVFHQLGGDGVGATKVNEQDLQRRLAVNRVYLTEWCVQHHLADAFAAGKIPFGWAAFDDWVFPGADDEQEQRLDTYTDEQIDEVANG